MSRTISLASIWKSLDRRKLPWQIATILGVGLGVAGLMVGTKQLGWWEMGELAVYDRSIRWKPSLPKDPRLLVVAISEEDLNLQKTWPLPDRTLAKAIQKLTDAKAKVIGLDVFRPNPVNPGAPELTKIWEQNDLIIPACQHRNFKNPGIAGPPGIPAEQLGFVDLLVDRDGIVRRALLFMARDPKSPCTSETSFALQLAQEYLIRQHQQQGKFDVNNQFSIGTAHFKPIYSTDGGYQSAESGGYQILLNYRSPSRAADRAGVAKIVTISDLLNDRVDPKLIKDRIVLIGSTASSLKDEFLTPYSAGKAEDATMPGVVVHAQIVSQIVSAVLDKQPLWWFMPDWVEGVWIGGWCLTGSVLAWYIRHPLKLFGAVGGMTILLVGGFAIAFTQTGWLPLVSPVVGLIASSIGMLGLTSYQTQQQQQAMTSLAIDRDRAIADLQLLLTQSATPVVPAADAVQPELPLTTAPTAIDPDLTVPHQLDVTIKQEQQPILSVAAGTMPPNYLLDGRYQADRSLGSGGFGVTYLARDTKRPGKPQCVIKQLVPARRDPSFVSLARRLFNTEAEILAKLGHHAQIPHLLAYFEDRQEFYLVQEFIDGTPLDRELEGATAPWSEAKVLDLLRQLLPVLGFIHSQRVIHRDLKPGNIIRDRHHGKLVLIDFGAVKEIQPQSTKEQDRTIAIGTRGYTPPEQYAGQPNYTSDLYSLGTIAIEALTNTHPRYLPVDDNTGDLIWHDRVSIDPQLVRVLDKMVAYHFRDRYQSATAVLIDLP
jgi:CHASE2 domain-containing sensor protein/tRNA A-37 threonylcarbamoyl transferase component Bud32